MKKMIGNGRSDLINRVLRSEKEEDSAQTHYDTNRLNLERNSKAFCSSLYEFMGVHTTKMLMPS